MNSDEIVEYLRNRVDRRVMTLDWYWWYKNLHGGSDPFCEVCDGKIRIGEEFYIFFVGGRTAMNVTPYHVRCVDRNSETPGVRTIVQQDRALRYGPETSEQ